MKKVIISIVLLLATASSFAQTTATDFTATDCKGNSHTLFTELNSGKTIVLVWVMPCTMCISGSNNAFNAVQNAVTTHPGDIEYYLIDDMGDDNCGAIGKWASDNGIDTSAITIFSNSGNTIDEANYGGMAMPHVVVVSGTDHKILYNEQNGSATGIDHALNVATSVKSAANEISFSIAPNPASGNLFISYSKAITKATVLSVTGQVVKEEAYGKGKMNPSISLNGIASGTYMLNVIDVDGKSGLQKIVKE